MINKTYMTKEDTLYLIKMKQESENNLGVVTHACNISTQKLGQENSRFEDSLSFIARLFQKEIFKKWEDKLQYGIEYCQI